MLLPPCSIRGHHLGMTLCYAKGPIHLDKVCHMNSCYKSTATSGVNSGYRFDPQFFFLYAFCKRYFENTH